MNLTIDALRTQAEKTEVGRLQFSLMLWAVKRPGYKEWVTLVEDAIYYLLTQMAGRRNDFNDLDEDALTAVIQIALSSLNMTVSAKVVNGNADVSIEFDTYRWLGEAKIASDVSKIYHGYQQLISRYSTGIENQNCGGMLLYCQHDSADRILSGWRAALEVQSPESGAKDGRHALSFTTTAKSNSTGIDLDIVHYGIPLHHAPKEDVLKLSDGAIKAARAARKSIRTKGDGSK